MPPFTKTPSAGPIDFSAYKDVTNTPAAVTTVGTTPKIITPQVVTTPVAAPAPITYNVDSTNTPSTLYTTPTPPTTPNYQSILASVPTVDSITTAQSPEQIAAAAEKKTLQTRILDVLKGIGGQSAAEATAEQNAGIPDLQKNLTDVEAQIKVLQNEANAIPLQIQQDSTGRGRTTEGIAPIQADRLRENAIKALTLSSIAEVYRGNLSTAQSQVDRAIKAEFDPKQAELDYLKAALDLNSSNMSDADKKQSVAIQAKLQDRQDELDKAKSDRDTTLKAVLTAAGNGAPAALLSQVQSMGPVEAVAALKDYLQPKQDPFTLAAGQSRYDANGKLIASVPAKDAITYDANGNPIVAPHGTAAQFLNAGFAARMKAVENNLTTLMPYINSLSLSDFLIQSKLPSAAQTPQYQQYEQYKKDFINAKLRQESGAAIAQSELDNADKQYFPQPGDSPQVITQKEANRALVTQGMIAAAGTAYQAPADVVQQVPGDISDAFDTVVFGNTVTTPPQVAGQSGGLMGPGNPLYTLFSSFF